MKKSLIALAALAVVSAASAQSTVTLFGIADINYRSVTSGDNKFTGLATDGLASSRIGFRGVEDLGGGLSANFHFEGGMSPDTGTPGGLNFLRKSTVGVASKALGEVRLGRDYTPLFTVLGIADPFGTNGVGSFLNIGGSTVVSDGSTLSGQEQQDITGTFTAGDRGTTRRTDVSGLRAAARTDARVTLADPNAVRANNSVAYYTPTIAGFSGSFMYTFGAENTYSLKKTGDGTSVRVGYAAGPLNVAFANQVTKGGLTATAAGFAASGGSTNTATTATNGTDDQKWNTNVLAASYDLGIAKLSYMHRTDKLEIAGVSDLNTKINLVGVTAPIGAFTAKASYATKKVGIDGVGSEKAGKQLAVGGVYDLSKRTALYSTYSVYTNEAGYANSVGSAAANGGDKSKGLDFGVRHSF